jgi:chromatin modification-related protein YNG2
VEEEGDEDAEGEDADGDDEKLYCFCQKHSYGDVSKISISSLCD